MLKVPYHQRVKPLFKLKVAPTQGLDKTQMALELAPDLVDPNGEPRPVANFDTPTQYKKYNSVVIRAASNKLIATVPVVEKPRP